jgi:hypothetical protein
MNNTIDDEPTRLIGHIYTVYEACHILQHHWFLSWVFVTKHTAGQKLLNTSVVLLLCNNDVNIYFQAMHTCIEEQKSWSGTSLSGGSFPAL